MHSRTLIAGLLLGSALALAHAHEYRFGALTIGHPYARPTAPSQRTGGGYLTLTATGAGDRLISASTPVSKSVEMHTMRLEGDVMRMREVSTIDVPAGKPVVLEPGGLHLMLVGLKAPLLVGQSFPMKLKFAKAGEVTVDLKVDAVVAEAAMPGMAAMPAHGHDKPH